jgi:hypothetical protein
MTSSRDIANMAILHIQAMPASSKKQICQALGITADQFQAATPYIRGKCELILCRWYVKT